MPNIVHPFKIQTSASNYALGTILTQHGLPIAYHSKTFNDMVQDCSTYENKLYAIGQPIKQWQHYILVKKS